LSRLFFPVSGKFDFGETLCSANSFVNLSIWLEHIIMFGLLKIDKVNVTQSLFFLQVLDSDLD
jgi:hypothetical protein